MPKQDGNQNSKSWLRWATFASFVKLCHMSSQSQNISGKADLRRSPAAVGGNCCPLPPLVTPLNSINVRPQGWLGSRVVSVLDSGAEEPGFKS